MAALCAYHWPGNIRELRNVVERAVLLCDADEISLDLLPDCLQTADAVQPQAQSDFRRAKAEAVDSFERLYLTNLLKRTGGNVRQAARTAGMRRTSMQRLLQKHKIDGRGLEGGRQDPPSHADDGAAGLSRGSHSM